MFKKLFTGLSKNNEDMKNREKELGTKAVTKKELQSLIANENNTPMGIEKGLNQHVDEGIQNITGTSVYDDSLTLEKSAEITTEKFTEYNLFYKYKFVNCKSINEVLDTYLKYTDLDDIMDEIRLTYVSMYLFNTSLSNDKLEIIDLKSLLAKRLSEMDIEKGLKQHVDGEIQSTTGTSVNDDSLTLEKQAKKTIEKFTEYKLFYKDKFVNCKSINEVLDTYLKYTDLDDIMDEIRLTYVSMYLFNTSLSNDKLEIIDLKSLLAKRLSETDIEKGLNQYVDEKIQSTTGTSVNDDSLTLEKPAKKTTEKFTEYKLFYKDKFVNCKSINEVLDTYLKYTDLDDIMDEIRLRYVSMYLFNTSLSNDKFSIKDLRSKLVKRLLADSKVDFTVMPDENKILNGKLYSEIKLNLENEIYLLNQTEQDVNLDRLLISLFQDYELEFIDWGVFLGSLLRVLKDIGLLKKDIEFDYFRSYLKQIILNIKGIEFWEEDEEKFYWCEILIIKRYIMVKTKSFRQIIHITKEGPIYINVTPINNNTLFIINIDGTDFVANERYRDKILNYFDFVNREILKDVNKKVNTIVKEVKNASLELITLIENFLNIMPLNILLDRDLYIAFEHLISFNSFVAQQLLDSNSEDRDNIIDKLKEDANFYNTLQSFIDENYKKLVKIAGKYINTAEEYHSSVIWKLIRKLSLQFMSEYWDKEYGIYIKDDIQAADLDEYIDVYCRCSDIPTKNIIAVGSFTYYLMSKDMFPKEIKRNFLQCNVYLIEKILQKIEELELEIFENRLTNRQVQKSAKYSINDVDLMDGYEFERFVSLLFTKMGYMTEITKGSGDKGMDVIAEKNGTRIGIQAKCYSGKVTNRAVQEIFTSLNYYNCNKGMVITNNYFTESALELAKSNNIILWDRDILKRKIDEIFK